MNTTYNYKILNDPMKTTDPDFFGLWNQKSQMWENHGILDYDKYSNELSSVIDAVKSGDYRLAKNHLLEYYREKYKYIKINPYPARTEKLDLCCRALEKNVYSANRMNGHIMDFFTVDEELKWYSADVAFSMDTLAFGSNVTVSYQLVSVDKTDISAKFYSRKSDHSPYLEIVINGEKVRVECCKDTMVSAGENSSVNYSENKVFEVCESGIYHNHDENMKRAYFAFDVSFINKNDVVSSAKLYLYGKSNKAEKEICVYNEHAANWDEKTFCWDNVTDELIFSCNDMNSWDFITSSVTTIKGKICFYHRGTELSIPADMYRRTGDEKYAYTFIRNAMAIVHYVGCNREVFNELDMGCYCSKHTTDLFRVINSKYMTGERFVAILKNIYAVTQWLINNFYGVKKNNWASFATMGVYCFIGFFSEIKSYDKWFDITVNENNRLIRGFIGKDGSNIELGQCYQSTLINTITGLYSIHELNRSKMPLSDEAFDIAHKLIKHYYYTLSPTGSDYNIADTTDPFKNLKERVAIWYNKYPDLLGDDEELKYVATDGKEGKLPDFTTINFPYNLRTYMKTDWSRDALAMVVNGRREGSHGHEDVFSIAMMAYGKHLVTDQGYGALLTGGIREMMMASSSHNVVLADDVENTWRKDSKQLGFDTNHKFDYCEYSGANNEIIDVQNRSVTFCKEDKFWIVTDYTKPINCEKDTKYTQYWHMLPEANISIGEQNVLKSNFADGINVMIVPVGKIENSEIIPSKYSPAHGVIVDSKKAKLVKNKKGEVLFSTLIIPINEGEDFKVESKCTDYDNVNSFVAKITDKNGVSKTYYFAHSNNQVKEISSGKYSEFAVNMIVCEDENGKAVSKYIIDK